MTQNIGLRFLPFEADITLRRLPPRTVNGLVEDEDRMPQYRGERPRVAVP